MLIIIHIYIQCHLGFAFYFVAGQLASFYEPPRLCQPRS